MEKGLVYKLSDKKVTDLQALSKFVSNEGERWIRELVERQKTLKKKQKKRKMQKQTQKQTQNFITTLKIWRKMKMYHWKLRMPSGKLLNKKNMWK